MYLHFKGMDPGFQHIITKIGAAIESVQKVLNSCFEDVDYDQLSTENKVRYDLFLAYSVNSLLWMHLRMNGQDPSQSIIRTELNRIKELMAELQRVIDRKTIMPRVDQDAAKRFVKHGLWDPNNSDNRSNKHIRFEE